MHIEHINLTVSDLDRSLHFYGELLGLRLRWRGLTKNGLPAAHLGSEETYLALFQSQHGPAASPADYLAPGFNHFGLQVEDLDRCRARLLQLGITPHHEEAYEPGRRLYFFDPDGIEVELVSYATAPLRTSGS